MKKYIPEAKKMINNDEINDYLDSDKKWFGDDKEAREQASSVASEMAYKLRLLFSGAFMREFYFRETITKEQ